MGRLWRICCKCLAGREGDGKDGRGGGGGGGRGVKEEEMEVEVQNSRVEGGGCEDGVEP